MSRKVKMKEPQFLNRSAKRKRTQSVYNVLINIPLFRDADDSSGGLEELAMALDVPNFCFLPQEELADVLAKRIVSGDAFDHKINV